jgi:hypothetical protein
MLPIQFVVHKHQCDDAVALHLTDPAKMINIQCERLLTKNKVAKQELYTKEIYTDLHKHPHHYVVQNATTLKVFKSLHKYADFQRFELLARYIAELCNAMMIDKAFVVLGEMQHVVKTNPYANLNKNLEKIGFGTAEVDVCSMMIQNVYDSFAAQCLGLSTLQCDCKQQCDTCLKKILVGLLLAFSVATDFIEIRENEYPSVDWTAKLDKNLERIAWLVSLLKERWSCPAVKWILDDNQIKKNVKEIVNTDIKSRIN